MKKYVHKKPRTEDMIQARIDALTCPYYITYPEGKAYRAIVCEWQEMSVEHHCRYCGWYPREAKRRHQNILDGLPPLTNRGGIK